MITKKLLISEPDYYSCELTKKFPIKVTLIAINGNTGFGINESLDSSEDTLKDYMSELQKNPSVINVDMNLWIPVRTRYKTICLNSKKILVSLMLI